MQVEVETGRLRGRFHEGAFSFRGIPYAAGTGGANRFRPPQRAAGWTGVREAITEGDRCPQIEERISQDPVFAWYAQRSAFSENCCVLNVFTPGLDHGTRRPVMLYIHGGGYASGGGGGPVLDGSTLATFSDAVVVTVNHRLNVFGYTNLLHLPGGEFPDAGNAGQLDLVAALEWVHRNIAVFGGDPDNVTLIGQSGGGNKVMVLLTMPAARGLFRRAINMSGVSGLWVARPDHTAPYVDALMQALGMSAADAHRLQAVPVDVLIKARQVAMRTVKDDGAQPIVDGRHVMAEPLSAMGLAMHAGVPLMLGTTATEATLFLGLDPRNFQVDDLQLKHRIRAQFGLSAERADALVDAYRQEASDRSAVDVLAHLSSDVLVRGPLLQAADTLAGAGRAPVFVYNFAWQVPAEHGPWRSPHMVDIPFAFGTVRHARAMTGTGAAPDRLAQHLMAAFAAFARTGDPSNRHMPGWRPYDGTARATMVIDEASRLVDDHHGADRRASLELLGTTPASLQRGPLMRPST